MGESTIRRLHGAGACVAEVARAIGVSWPTAKARLAALGLRPPADGRHSPRAWHYVRRRQRQYARRHECASVGQVHRLRRLRRYVGRGYPAGVSTATQAAAVDLARAGAVTAGDVARRLAVSATRAWWTLKRLAECGVLRRAEVRRTDGRRGRPTTCYVLSAGPPAVVRVRIAGA